MVFQRQLSKRDGSPMSQFLCLCHMGFANSLRKLAAGLEPVHSVGKVNIRTDCDTDYAFGCYHGSCVKMIFN